MADAIQQLRTAVADSYAFRYVVVASFTFYALDYLQTLPDEKRLIWGSKWSIGTLLYRVERVTLLIAYILYGHLYFLMNPSVHGMYILTATTAYVVVQPVAALSILRTYALYHGCPKVKVFLWVAYGMWMIASTTCFVFLFVGTTFAAPPIKGYTCLFVIRPASTTVYVFLQGAATVYEWTIASLALFRVGKHALLGESEVVRIMLRDGVAFILLISLGNLTSLVLWTVIPDSHAMYRTILTTPIQGFYAIIMCRTILNLREYGTKSVHRSDGGRVVSEGGSTLGVQSNKAQGVFGMTVLGAKPSRTPRGGNTLPYSCTEYNERALNVAGMSFAPRETTTVTTLTHQPSQTFGTGSSVIDEVGAEGQAVPPYAMDMDGVSEDDLTRYTRLERVREGYAGGV